MGGDILVVGVENPDTPAEAATQALGDAQRYMDRLYEENPTAARLTEVAITGALGGPVKAAVSVPAEMALEQALGEEMAAAMDTVADYAGAAVTDQDETVGEFQQDTQITGYEGDQARIKDGGRFIIPTVLGVGPPGRRGRAETENAGGRDGTAGPKTQIASEDSVTVESARQRQHEMLDEDVGYNVSPNSWDRYPTLGPDGTFITDQKALTDVLGPIEGKTVVTISTDQARQLERALGLRENSLQNGSKIRSVSGVRERNPRSPLEGNEHFQGGGQHLPGGGPEAVIDSIPSVDTNGVTTLLEIKVE
jgi:filamentous hemagglutinin